MPEKILVVDDEPLISTAIERALSKSGYLISKARNSKELEEVLKDAPFDLLITDVYMHDDTIEHVIEKVLKTSPSVKVLKMSGSMSREATDNFIEKPFSISALRQKVEDLLNEPS